MKSTSPVVLALFAAATLAVVASDKISPVSPTSQCCAVDEKRIETLLAQLTLDEKIDMLGGDETGFNSKGVVRLGIPPIRMSDGPVGVRDGASNAYPVSANMAATWDPALIERFGAALGEDTLAKGKHAILGPCVGIGRYPLGGRNFEAFGEDPYLSSRMAVSTIHGIQSRQVIATVKHFACNDQEWERNNYDVKVDERSLHEVHLLPFEAAVKEGQVWMLMTAYNLVNGQHMSENARLVREILKGEWGYQGLVVSDWTSVYSSKDAAINGLDIEMPTPLYFGDKLRADVTAGRVPVAVIDEKIRRHLRVRLRAGVFDNPAPAINDAVIRSQVHRDLALEMAEKSIVLLKNDGVLPLDKTTLKSVAVVGPHAGVARAGGGGSSQVAPWIAVSPVDGLRAKLPISVAVECSPGVVVDGYKAVPLPSNWLRTPDGKSEGLAGEYFNNTEFAGKPAFTRIDKGLDFDWGNNGPGHGLGGSNYSVRWTGTVSVAETGPYRLAITSDDGSFLYIDEKLVADNGGTHAEITIPADIELLAGRTYRVRIDYVQGTGGAAMRLGWKDPQDRSLDPTIDDAVAAARAAGVAIVCVGNAANQEGEGADVADFKLFGRQQELLDKVLAATPNTIVVVYGGVPVTMKPWLAKARAVVVALYPGQEGGTALASLLLGEKNFSGKLPFSYIQERSECPGFIGYKDAGLKVPYSEGVFTGYRWYDAHAINPLFPFGHGLSYTSFGYSDFTVKADAQGPPGGDAHGAQHRQGRWRRDRAILRGAEAVAAAPPGAGVKGVWPGEPEGRRGEDHSRGPRRARLELLRPGQTRLGDRCGQLRCACRRQLA
ncbi:MAG: glycoside hydrolase family 3 C-terminal domain-containing protein [Opitutaceae bacterium]|nr:glycoside hydrolase family 3 C-terminal domain-containing protein [Opitutaceae bacterium]